MLARASRAASLVPWPRSETSGEMAPALTMRTGAPWLLPARSHSTFAERCCVPSLGWDSNVTSFLAICVWFSGTAFARRASAATARRREARGEVDTELIRLHAAVALARAELTRRLREGMGVAPRVSAQQRHALPCVQAAAMGE